MRIQAWEIWKIWHEDTSIIGIVGNQMCIRDRTVTAGGYKIIKFDPYLKRGHISFRQEI